MVIRCNLLILSGTTLGKIPLGKGSACSRDLYLTTQNIHERQRTIPQARFESANKRVSIYSLDGAATCIGELIREKSVNMHPGFLMFLSRGSQKDHVKEKVSDLHKATWKWYFDRLVLLLQTHSITRVVKEINHFLQQ